MANEKTEVKGASKVPTATVSLPVYQNPTPGQLPIMACGMLEGDTFFGPFLLDLFKKCGANIAQASLEATWQEEITGRGMNGETIHIPRSQFKEILDKSYDNLPDDDRGHIPDEEGLYNNSYWSLAYASQTGMRIMLRWYYGNDALWRRFAQMEVDNFGENYYVAGFMTWDEPTLDQLYRVKMATDIFEAKSDKLVYTDLHSAVVYEPDKKSGTELTGSIWMKYIYYVSKFREDCHHTVLSNARYAFTGRKLSADGTPVGEITIAKEYFNNLMYFHLLSKTYPVPIPFWAYIRVAYKGPELGYEGFDSPIVTVPFLRYQAYTALMFGAQGLVCWKMCERRNYVKDEKNGGLKLDLEKSFPVTPIKTDGSKTQIYYNLKTVLENVRKYQHVFLGGIVRDIVKTNVPDVGGSYPYDAIPTLFGGIGAISKITLPNSVILPPLNPILPPVNPIEERVSVDKDSSSIPISISSDLLVSHIENNGKEYMILFNLNWSRETQFRVCFSKTVKSLMTGFLYHETPQNSQGELFTLSECDWLIFEVQ